MSIRSSWRGLPRHSSWFPDAKVDSDRDGSWRHHCFTRFYLATKHSHVGVDVFIPVCRLHHHITYGCQTRAHGTLTDATLLYLIAKLLLGVLLPEWARTLWLSNKGVESMVRRRLVQSPCVGQCRIQTVSSRG
jgi:hypothetical protein